MKKARKKRIVRRKRRISEREIMRIKRKLKKSTRKLRLGAKRTGAYVYGTLRRIVGNPAIPAHMGNPEFVREFRIGEMRARVSGEPVGLYAYRTKGGWGFITRKQSMYRPPGEELVVLFGEKRGLRGNRVVKKNPLEKMGVYAGRSGFEITDFKKGDRIQLHPGMDLWMRGAKYGQIIGIGRKKLQVKLDYLRRPIAISPRNIGEIMYREMSENRRRTHGRRRIVRVLGYDVVEGSKKHMRLLAQKRHFDDLQRGERGLRGNPSKNYYAELLKAGIPMDHHESDLYVMDTPEARRILSDWPFGRLERFRNNINGKIYIDVPFGYMPYWERKMR